MSKDLSAEQALANFQQSFRQMEATAVELVDPGRALFKDGEPAEPDLQRRYRLYKRVEAASATTRTGARSGLACGNDRW
jgi:hypothetical protein